MTPSTTAIPPYVFFFSSGCVSSGTGTDSTYRVLRRVPQGPRPEYPVAVSTVRDVMEKKGLLTSEELDGALDVRAMTEPGLPKT